MPCGDRSACRQKHARKHTTARERDREREKTQQPPASEKTPPPPPLATAAVLQEAVVPLADQILSVTFPLINGHLFPPFSPRGYALPLRRSNHLIAVTFNPIRSRCPWLPACRASPPPPTGSPSPATTYQLWEHKGRLLEKTKTLIMTLMPGTDQAGSEINKSFIYLFSWRFLLIPFLKKIKFCLGVGRERGAGDRGFAQSCHDFLLHWEEWHN